jgi:hypothetical protein
MKQQHAALMTLGVMLMLACRGITAEEPGRGPFERQVEFTAIGVPTLKNAPFIALVQSTWVRPTGEGYPHVLRSTARIMRDTAGHVRQEHWTMAPDDNQAQSVLEYISIMDPVNGTGTWCELRTHVCTVDELNARASSVPTGHMEKTGDSHAPNGDKIYNLHEDLGTAVLQDVKTVVFRDTKIDEDPDDRNRKHHGREQFQYWYSGELGFYLRRVVTSDEIGQLSVEVTDLNREEPDAQKFVIPDGFLTKRAKHSDSPSPEN